MKQRYAIEALSFHCIDESGKDWLGSDEPMFVFTWTNGANGATTRTREFGDVDSGDKRAVNQFIAGSKAKGVAGPIGLSVQLYEIDQGGHDNVKNTVDKVLTAAKIGTILLGGPPVPVLPDPVLDKLTTLFGNDLLGSVNVTFSAAQLQQRLPKVGQSFAHVVRFKGDNGFFDFEGGADYDLVLRVARRADAA
ncbi:MAG: hypothetical protein ACKVWR_03510 [Acidimicrobiales bacterium]